MRKLQGIGLLLIIMVALAACRPPSPGTEADDESGNDNVSTTEEAQTAEPPLQTPGAATAAQSTIAQSLGLEQGEVQIMSFEAIDWADSCLGFGGPDESCLAVITPGWRIMLSADGEFYEAHTDATGNQVRFQPAE